MAVWPMLVEGGATQQGEDFNAGLSSLVEAGRSCRFTPFRRNIANATTQAVAASQTP